MPTDEFLIIVLHEHRGQEQIYSNARTEIQDILKTGDPTPLVCARCLGYLVLEAPTDVALSTKYRTELYLPLPWEKNDIKDELFRSLG